MIFFRLFRRICWPKTKNMERTSGKVLLGKESSKGLRKLERDMGFEPTTFSLGS